MQDKKHPLKTQKEVLAFAPFSYGDAAADPASKSGGEKTNLAPLPFSGMEVDAIVKILKGDAFKGTDATLKRFTDLAGNYHILHITTHALSGDGGYLAFATTANSAQQSLIYAKDIYNLKLNTDMVVLSGCETGTGKLRNGEGIISLGRAFAYSGSKSILSTLWKVNNRNTAELVPLFYHELHQGKTKDEALYAAREAYFNKSTALGCHPFFWAAFFPVGDMRAIMK